MKHTFGLHVKRRSKLIKTLAVGTICAAFTIGSMEAASANPYTWQSYTRDGSWNCGPAGSTVYLNGLYLLPCTKLVGSYWQVILIVTGGSSTTAVTAQIFETRSKGYCNDHGTGTTSYPYNILPGQSLACFGTTQSDPGGVWVQGNVDVRVMDTSGQWEEQILPSPGVVTGS